MTGRRIPSLLLLLVFWLGLNIVTMHPPEIFPVDGQFAIEYAKVVASEVTNPEELPVEGWTSVTLPDDWWQAKRTSKQHWYRFELGEIAGNTDRLAAYLPTVTHNAAVFLNGIWIGQGGRFEPTIARNQNRPLIFSFTAEQLNPSNNILLIRVATESARQGLLGKVYIGNQEALTRAHGIKQFIRVDAIFFLSIAMYLLGIVLLAIWLIRRQDTIYLVFSAELVLWATHNLNLFVRDIPTSARAWEAMTMATLGWTVVMMIFYNHRYVNHRFRFAEPALWIFSLAGLGFFLSPNIENILSFGYVVWDSGLIIIGIYAMIHLLRNYWLQPSWDYYLLLLAGTPIIVFGFHDILLVNGFIGRSQGLIIQYSGLPVIIVFTWFLLHRFVASINHAERLSAELQQRVDQREAELAIQYKRLAKLEREQTLISERERIMRDMHDGIGGHLVRTLSLLDNTEKDNTDALRDEIKQGITDLRLVVNSLDPMLGDIGTLLGAMRQRLQEQLAGSDIQLDWQVGDLPDGGELTPQQTLHILRILQEGVTNIIKHSGASRATLNTNYQVQNQTVAISLEDDGHGFDIAASHDQLKRGVRNMRFRAEQAKIGLILKSSTRGTELQLLIDYKI